MRFLDAWRTILRTNPASRPSSGGFAPCPVLAAHLRRVELDRFMPLHPPMIILRTDGTVLGNHGWNFSTWANSKTSRIALQLTLEHAPYIRAISAAVRG